MSQEIKAKLNQDMKDAMKAKQKERLAVIRMLLAAVKQREVDDRVEADDQLVLAILEKQAKQRKESAKAYHEADRSDLATQEEAELEIIQSYLPEALSAEEIESAVSETISQLGASSMQDMGKVMGALKGKLQGRADMGEVSKIIKARLS